MHTLLELAERCEKATGPDRDLDAEIAPLTGLRFVDEGHPLGRCCYDERGHGVPLPAYTASLDAALTLVPEGWCKTVADYWCEGEDRPPFYADCGDLAALKAGSDDAAIVKAWAQTPALALCAAALKARADAPCDEQPKAEDPLAGLSGEAMPGRSGAEGEGGAL